MKTLNKFIIEKLKLGKDTKIYKIEYKFFPKDFDELRSLIEQLLKERGPDANLNDIDVSKITSFCTESTKIGLFENLDPHNIDISEWDVSNVENMYSTFYKCKNLDCDLSKWDVSKVTNMNWMFWLCKNFDSNLSKWNVSNVETMDHMFYGCKKFIGQGLENWKPIKVCNIDHIFYACTNLDCNLENWPIDKLEFMKYAFEGCTSLTNKPSWYKE